MVIEFVEITTYTMRIKNYKNMKTKIFLLVIAVVSFAACNKTAKNEEVAVLVDSVAAVEQQPDSIIEMGRIGIRMQKKGGVYMLPALVNGVKMNFIFDTGASHVSISMTEALFMVKNGYLKEEDIIGSSYSKLADGRKIENVSVILREIEIEGIILENVSARIVDNIEAPLLLGQTAISKLGRIEFVGDSLYIIRQLKTKRSNVSSDLPKVEDELQKLSFWQQIRKWFGIENECEKYINLATEARANDLDLVAAKYLKQAIEEDDENWRAYYELGRVELSLGRDYNSFINYEKAYELNENKENYEKFLEDYLYCLGFINEKSWDKKEYLNKFFDLIVELLEQNPNNIKAYNCLGYYYLRTANYEQALKYAKKMLELEPNNSNGYFRLATIYDFQGRSSKAILNYEKAISLQPDKGIYYNNLSQLYWNRNRIYAVELRKKAAELGKTNAQEWLRKNGYDW